MAVVSPIFGLLGSGSIIVRLMFLVMMPVFFAWVVVLAVLRALAFARPGAVRAGLGREWVSVSTPEDIAVDTGAGRWPQICVFNNPKSPALVTTPGPLWFGSQRRFRQALDAARDKLADAHFLTVHHGPHGNDIQTPWRPPPSNVLLGGVHLRDRNLVTDVELFSARNGTSN